MGGKPFCEQKRCNEEAKFVCLCFYIRLCPHHVKRHKLSNRNLYHKIVDIAEFKPIAFDPGQTIDRINTMEGLTLNRNIYQSPEGSTEVWEGNIKGIPDKVAIKIMHCRNEGEYNKRRQEAEYQLSMKHPNICGCVCAFRDMAVKDRYKFVIVMEYSEFGDVEQDIDSRRARSSPWPEDELLHHMTELIDAFAFLQEKNLVHGDVKPRNLFMTSQGRMKIGDFGESRQESALVTKTYQIAGTVIYFSPALFKAYLDIIKGINTTGTTRHNPIKSDVYSLGLTFMHIASLEKPVDLNNLEQGFDKLQSKILLAISRLNYSEKLKKLFMLMLEVEEAKRYDFIQLRLHLVRTINAVLELEEPELVSQLSHINDSNIRGIPSRVPPPIFSIPIIFNLSEKAGQAVVYHIKEARQRSVTNHRFQHSSRAILLHDTLIFLAGGLKNSKNAYKIDIAIHSTIKLKQMNEPRAWHCMVNLGEDIFCIGGRNTETKKAINSVEVFRNENWEVIESLQKPREIASAISVNDAVYVIGGSSDQNGHWELLNSIEKYENSAWVILDVVLPDAMGGVGIVAPNSDEILIFGGKRERGSLSRDIYSWNISTNQFASKNPLPEAELFYSNNSMIENEKIFIIGSLKGLLIYDRAEDTSIFQSIEKK